MYKKLNLIIVCGSLYRRNLKTDSCSSGSDISMEEEIEKMRPFANHIDIVSLIKDGLVDKEVINPEMTVHRVDESHVREKIKEIHLNINKGETDYIITQLLLCDIALEESKNLDIPSIYYMRSTGSGLPISKGQRLEPTRFVANSKYTASQALKAYGVEPIVSYASYTDRVGEYNPNPEYDFLMFNPNEEKGGHIFLELARRYKNKKFIAVRGWEELKNINGQFNRGLMLLMAKAHGGDEIIEEYVPKDVVFPELPNFKLIMPEKHPGRLLQNTKVVIIPSQWDEAFPRVLIEAGLNKKLVIASNVGGIPEAMHIAGMPEEFISNLLVSDQTNINSWFKTFDWYFEHEAEIPSPAPNLPSSNIVNVLY